MNLTHNRGWLADAAAASLHRVDARLGRPVDINEAGRTRARQQELWNLYYYPNGTVRPASQRPSWLGRPAKPGTSRHETGMAIDTDDRISWIGQHGWVANVAGEPWHFEYFPARDQYRTAGTSAAPAFPLPAGYYFGPKSGPKQSVSGYFSYRDQLRTWQARMAQRGWAITADGLYGAKTADVVKRFQREKGLTVDGKIGPATWAAAWTAPVT